MNVALTIGRIEEISNPDLIRRCASSPDDSTLWQEFIRRFDDFLRRTAVRLLGSPVVPAPARLVALVEDIVQDVYVRLLHDDCRALLQFRGENEEAIFPYLHSITATVILNHFRATRAKKRPRVERSLNASIAWAEEDFRPLSAVIPDPRTLSEEEIRLAELRDEINYLLDRILHGPNKSRDKLIFQLFHFDGLSPEEIAQISAIDMNPHGIEVVLSRIRQKLERFAEQFFKNS